MDRPNPEGDRAPPDRENESASAANKRLRIVTRCGTLEEFFATFGPFADEASLFIVTNKPRPLGLRQPFVIQLKDGDTIMRGDVEVVQSITDGTGPDGRNGMRLRLENADDATRDILRRLVAHAKERRARSTERPPDSVAVASEARPAVGETKAPPRPPGPPPAAGAAPATIAPKASASDDAPPPSRGGLDLAGSGERAPGATYQLPANPFEGVTAEALESFVECTLYEERVPRGPEADSPLTDAPPPSRSGAGLSSFPQSIVTAAPATLAPPGSPALPPLPALPPPPPTFAAPPPPTFGPTPAQSAAASPASISGSAPVRDAVLLAAAIQAASVPQRRPWLAWVIGAAVASSVASLGAAYLVWGPGHAPSPVASVPAVTSPVPERTGSSASPPTATATATAAPTASATASASATSEPSAPALKRECKANVRSYPPGATVQWNGESIGLSPLGDVPVPCGPAKVTFDLTGYEHGERSAGAVVGKNAGVFLRLVPILVAVAVTSKPPGAQILVDGRTVGRTPASITMTGMREATLVVTLPHYKAFTQKVTPEPPKMSIHADLTPSR